MVEVRWENLRAPALRDLAARRATALVPVGSMEQHGPHLPVQVDALLATEVSVRAARRVAAAPEPLGEPIVVAPTVWAGLAEHHMGFGATITLDFDTFRGLLGCVCRSIARHGFPRILIVNGHGGNVSALGVLAGELEREVGAAVAAATYWHLAGVARTFPEILEHQSNVRHACEAESSMLLALRPDLVDRAAMAAIAGRLESTVHKSGAYRYRSFTELTESGAIGHPAAATPEKGEQLLEAAAAALADVIRDRSIWQ